MTTATDRNPATLDRKGLDRFTEGETVFKAKPAKNVGQAGAVEGIEGVGVDCRFKGNCRRRQRHPDEKLVAAKGSAGSARKIPWMPSKSWHTRSE